MRHNTMIRGLIPLIIFIFLVSISYADYPFLNQNSFKYGTANFNDATSETYVPASSGDAFSYNAVTGDLDSNGVNELYIIDDDTFLVYNYSQNVLNIVDSFSLSSSVRRSPPIIYDIDGDGKDEVIIYEIQDVGDFGYLHMFEFASGTLTNTSKRLTYNYDAYNIVVGCKGTNDCLVSYNNAGATGALFTRTFNSTNPSIDSISLSAGDVLCIPNIRYILNDDYDGDGVTEFLLSYAYSTGSNVYYVIKAYNTENQSNLLTDKTITHTTSISLGAGGTCTSKPIGQDITSPLVYDFDPSEPGKEILIGLMDDTDEFRIFEFKNDGAFEDEFPELTQEPGQIISNIIRMNAFGDSTSDDACVLGYRTATEEIILVCASKTRGGLSPESEVYHYDINTSSVLSSDENFQTLIHSVEAYTQIVDGDNIQELLTPFGTFYLDAARTGFDVDLNRLWVNDYAPATIIPDDFTGNSRIDLLMVKPNNLWMVTDSFINTHCDTYNCIRNGSYTNPSITKSIKVNTTFHVYLNIEDYDGDNVAGRVVLYADTTNEQDSGWIGNYSSGTIIPFTTLKVNKTGTYNIKFMARDVDDITAIQTITLPFTISAVGDEFGDSYFYFGSSTTTESSTNATTGNAVVEMADQLSDATGLSKGIIWLIFMALIPLVGMYLMFQAGISGSQIFHGFVFIGLFEIIWFVLGVLFGFISTGILIAVVVIALAIVALWLSRVLGRGEVM